MVISGERNLLGVSDLSTDMETLRRLFDLFEQKTQLMRLLDMSSGAQGVRIYIGGESQMVPIEEMSMVVAPYEVDGKVVGTLGVDRPDAHGLRPHDPDRRHHRQAAFQRPIAKLSAPRVRDRLRRSHVHSERYGSRCARTAQD